MANRDSNHLLDMKTLLLVDGSSYLYRAFHALLGLRNKKGDPPGAIHGVLTMLRKLQKETPADYIACVFDAKGKTFRDDVYGFDRRQVAAMQRPGKQAGGRARTARGPVEVGKMRADM